VTAFTTPLVMISIHMISILVTLLVMISIQMLLTILGSGDISAVGAVLWLLLAPVPYWLGWRIAELARLQTARETGI
jgi:hypothetical protein